jgi:hypothetical protein
MDQEYSVAGSHRKQNKSTTKVIEKSTKIFARGKISRIVIYRGVLLDISIQ